MPTTNPLDTLPVFSNEAKNRVSAQVAEDLAHARLGQGQLDAFAQGNLGFDDEEMRAYGVAALQNFATAWSMPAWRIALNIYLVGMFDMARIFQAQNDIDAARVKQGVQ